MTYSIQHITELIAGTLLRATAHQRPIQHIVLDIRQLIAPADSLCFILDASSASPQSSLDEWYALGLRSFVLNKLDSPTAYPEANFILVEDVATALLKLAAQHRATFDLPIVALTKHRDTIPLKNCLVQLLRQARKVLSTSSVYPPLQSISQAVFSMATHHELGIFHTENLPTAFQAWPSVLKAEVGIYLNHEVGLPPAPLADDFAMLNQAAILIYCKDKARRGKDLPEALAHKKCFSWSLNTTADLQYLRLEKAGTPNATVHALHKAQALTLSVPELTEDQLPKLFYSWSLLLCWQYSAQEIASIFNNFQGQTKGITIQEKKNGGYLLQHNQAEDLNTLLEGLFLLQQQSPGHSRTLILSDFDQFANCATLLRDCFVAQRIEKLITIGSQTKVLASLLPTSIRHHHFATSQEFITQPSLPLAPNENVLLHGTAVFDFTKIVHRLASKVHQTVLEINLTALRHNLTVHQHYLQAQTKMMVMVKAVAYGAGHIPIAKSLVDHGVDYLSVAYVDEGVQLRRAGIQSPIFVLNPEVHSFELLTSFQLEPEIYSLRILQQYISYLETHAITNAPIHLKLDTGMHRLGFSSTELPELVKCLQACPSLRVYSILSHLVGSEREVHDDFSHQQVRAFQLMYEQLTAQLGYQPMRHLLNSSGIVRFPAYQFEMVRLGIGLYGIDNNEGYQLPLRPIHRLKTTISQIRTIAPNETVGYDRQGKRATTSRIATICIGYADGLLRGAGMGRYQVLLRHQKVPIIGIVCMDMCMLDISQVPDAAEGDEVIIFDSQTSVQALADCLDTITYEVFTNISERVKKVHFEE